MKRSKLTASAMSRGFPDENVADDDDWMQTSPRATGRAGLHAFSDVAFVADIGVAQAENAGVLFLS